MEFPPTFWEHVKIWIENKEITIEFEVRYTTPSPL